MVNIGYEKEKSKTDADYCYWNNRCGDSYIFCIFCGILVLTERAGIICRQIWVEQTIASSPLREDEESPGSTGQDAG